MANHETNSMLNQKPRLHVRSSSSPEEWGEGSSSYSSNSSYSETYSEDSYIANWENHIGADGSLFYTEFSYHGTHKIASSPNENALNVMKGDFSRASTRRSTSKKPLATNKLSRLIGKSESKKDDHHQRGGHHQSSGETSKVTFSEGTQGEIKEFEMVINPENRFKFGRRASASESMLGISTCPFPDGNRVMVAGFMSNSQIGNEKVVKVGDWFKQINNMDITMQNLDEMLNQFLRPVKVVLKFQRILGEEQIIPNSNTIHTIDNFELFASQAHHLLTSTHGDHGKRQIPNEMVLSMMILTLEFSDADIEANDVIFCYPEKEENVLFGVRGSFLTLNSILKSELKSEPITSSVVVNNREYHLCYHSYNKILLLYAIYAKYSTLKELRLRTLELVQYFQFMYLGLDIAFTDTIRNEIRYVCEILKAQLIDNKGLPRFESILQESHIVPLPKEAQLRIYDAVSEMEAMDYREWNDEPLNSHREFFIFGSALFFKSYLLASHLPIAQLAGLESFLRCRGIFSFIDKQNVRDFVLWQEIPMMSTSSRFFLAISSRNQLILATILQSFEIEQRVSESGAVEEKVIGPSLFYIEEIQETLDHLRHGGIEALARVWMTSNKRPEIILSPSGSQNKQLNIVPSKRPEVISILKHRTNSSEDVRVESSAGGSSIQSEDSNHKAEECDSDSDWDGFPESHKGSSGFDMSEMKDSFLKEVSDIVPSKITAGKENVLYHYVHLDIGTGMILSPPEIGMDSIVKSFRSACYLIHGVLQNTKKFRRLLAQESVKPNTHKSLVAIKEHGILISVKGESGNENSFWVVGRLFTSPTRELYVCHRSDIPQNLVEIAFRLSFITAG